MRFSIVVCFRVSVHQADIHFQVLSDEGAEAPSLGSATTLEPGKIKA
jgi:hypothetical protein